MKLFEKRSNTAKLSVILFFITITVNAAEYDLSTYLKKVEQNNTDISLALREIEAARQTVIQARSAFFPSIGTQGDYKRNFLDRTQSTAVASLPGGGPLVYQDVDANYDNELTLGVGLKQTIFDAGAIANYSQAKKGQAIREQSFEAVKQNLRNAAKKLYAQAQLAQRVIGIMENSEQTCMEIYQSIERKYRAGAATELDLLMAEVDWKSKVPQTAEARKNSEICMLALRNLAGIPLSEELILTEQNDSLSVTAETQTFDSLLASRPDYRALVLSRELADIQKKAAIGSFFPTVSAGLSFAYGGMGNGGSLMGDYDYTALQLSLGVSIPLFTGGYRVSRIKSAQIEQDKASLSILKKQNDIESQLMELQMRLDETMERIESAQLIETTAKRAAALAQSAYTNGLTTQLSVTESINKLDQASLGLQNALFEYRCAYYDWELAAGLE